MPVSAVVPVAPTPPTVIVSGEVNALLKRRMNPSTDPSEVGAKVIVSCNFWLGARHNDIDFELKAALLDTILLILSVSVPILLIS